MARYRWIPEDKKWIEIDEMRTDPNAGLNGPVYCPEGGYYDMALNKRFNDKDEKRQYMKENRLRMDGNDKPVDKRGVYYFIPGSGSNPRYYKNR